MKELSKAILKKQDKILLLKRKPTSKNYRNSWDLPGGKLEPGETPDRALEREVEEETGYHVRPGNKTATRDHKDRDHHLRFHYYAPETPEGEPELSKDHTEAKWCTEEDLESLELHPSVKHRPTP